MHPPPDPLPGFRRQPWWLIALAAVALGQAGLALQLFGPDDPPAGLTDPRPVVSGRHPLHLYHGFLGAATFRDRYGSSCYDPDFQAGYPKTPVFDGGSRPAEAFLAVAGGRYDPAAYKLGLFAVCVAAPLGFAVAGRAAGLSAAGAVLAAVGGCLVWWSPPVRALLDAGHLDLLLAGLMALLFVGGLVKYATEPGPVGWLLLAGPAVVGWYAHPTVWLGLLPVVAAYYVAQAPRHGPAWHLGLAGVTAAGLAPNLWWLWDWGRFWWLRQPSVDDLAPLPCAVTVIGCPADYAAILGPGVLGWVALGAGAGGLLAMVRTGHRTAAGVVVAAVLLTVAAARLGATWPTLQVVQADRAAPFAVAVLVLPAAFLLARWWERAKVGALAVCAAAAVPLALGWLPGMPADEPGLSLAPLALGLTPDQEQLVAALRERTTPDARILLEESDAGRPGWNWTALLPVLTDRAFLGGLDPDAGVDHTFCGLRDGRLNGRPLADWTAAERAGFCRRYNVGWVVCRTPAAADWWAADPSARVVGRFRDGGEVVLVRLERERSFVLTGSATVDKLTRRQVVLTDAEPDPRTGDLVLSLHHQPGLRAAPPVVWVDPAGDKDLHDPIPMVKLRLPGPVSRVTLTWEQW